MITGLFSPAFPQGIVINHTCTDLSRIPDSWISQAQSDLHIAYQHTSHGSQLITGMNALENFPSFGTKYEWSDNGSSGLDLDDKGIPGDEPDLSQGDYIDGNGVTPWVTSTRNLLDNTNNYHVNVIVWSWCSINMHNPQRYVDNMEILVSEYSVGGSASRAADHPVKFVFMTGHAQGQGENLYSDPDASGNGHVHYNNQLIRNHCASYGRILFDFADIEAYDPGGDYYWDLNMTDTLNYTGGNWGVEWIDKNVGSELEQLTTGNGITGYDGCSACAHCNGSDNKDRINCVLKGQATWWMWSRLAGWNGQTGATTPTPTLTPVGGLTPTPTPSPEVSTPTPPPVPSPTPSSCCTSTTTPTITSSPTSTTCPCLVTPTPIPVPTLPFSSIHSGDFNGDGTDDIGIFRPESGLWAIRGITRFYFGSVDDYPVCGDYSGDRTTSIGIFRDTIGLWAIHQITRFYFGGAADLPVPADYDGDGFCDIGIFRPTTGLWAVPKVTRFYFGSSVDRPLPGDYSGNGTDIAGIYRPTTGLWALRDSSRIYFGNSGDSPIPGDYDKDGTCDIGIFRGNSGLWAVRGVSRVYFGSSSDSPVPGDYNGDGDTDMGIFRSSSGLWAIRGVTRVYFAGSGDIPVVR